jgi:hypothetical protein
MYRIVRLVPTVLSCLFIIIIIIMKAVKNADARYIDYRTVWVGPDRSVESSFVFYFIIIMKKSKRQRPRRPL